MFYIAIINDDNTFTVYLDRLTSDDDAVYPLAELDAWCARRVETLRNVHYKEVK